MPFDKFGRNGDSLYWNKYSNLTTSFLRRGEIITAIGAIDINSHIINNVAESLSNQDVATKHYVDKNAITTAGSVVSGDIK